MKPFILLFAFLALTAGAAQEPKRITRTISPDDAVILREIGAVIMPKEGSLVIEVVLGNTGQQEADIKAQDEVLMANGKRVKSLKDLREQYDDAPVGKEFKIGLKRGENLQIARFIRKSEEELNQGGGGGGGRTMTFRMERKEGEEMLPALGLGVLTKEGRAVVGNVLPTAGNNFTSFTPKEGDVIVSLNGTAVASSEAFVKGYDELKEGDAVTIVFRRGGKESSASFKKPKPMGRMMMITK